MTRKEFHVKDLRYEHTMVGLRRQLQRCPGIHNVATEPGRSMATITFDASRWSAGGIEHLIGECGYVCHCQGDTGAD